MDAQEIGCAKPGARRERSAYTSGMPIEAPLAAPQAPDESPQLRTINGVDELLALLEQRKRQIFAEEQRPPERPATFAEIYAGWAEQH